MEQPTIVITGASDGIGAASARQLAANGRRVVLVGRSPAKTAAVADELGAPHHVADFTDLGQVRALADELLEAYPRIDVLANNAGGIFDRRTTTDGFDLTFQVNHLAPFLLTTRLMDRLIESDAKIIQTSSIGARLFGKLDLDDLENQTRWTANKAYGDAKLANILFTKELDRRYGRQGLSAVAFHPGNIRTSFASDTSSLMRFSYQTPLRHVFLASADKGGAALTRLAEGTPGTTWRSGEYYERGKVATKVNPQCADTALAVGLWDRSEAMVGRVGA